MADEEKWYDVPEGQIAPPPGMYTDGENVMSEAEMVQRIEDWYDRLSPEDQKKFTDRLWAAVTEEQREQRPEAGTDPEAGTVEGPGPDEADRPESDSAEAGSVINIEKG